MREFMPVSVAMRKRRAYHFACGVGVKDSKLARQMHGATDASAGEVELPRLGLGQRNQLACGLHRQPGIHRQHVGTVADLADKRERLDGVKRQLPIHRRAERVRGRDHQHGLPVRAGLGGHIDAEIAASPGPIVDDERLTEPLAQVQADQPADDVVAAAGGNGMMNRTGRVGHSSAARAPGAIARKRAALAIHLQCSGT
ncbi:MAG: hypothetical protein IT530_17090 [Burkholderiales bacterium]|nr:hypothetical protein [Burkholderiales bacterium]